MPEEYINRKTTIVMTVIALLAGLILGVILEFDYPERAIREETEIMETEEKEDEETVVYEPDISHEERVIETVERATEGVVSVKMEGRTIGGSGFFVSSDGLILTNRHVVAQDGNYYVITHEGEKLDAEVVVRDTARDLAFLEVDGNDFKVNPRGDSDGLRLGQTAIAIGYTLGEFENSVSVGVVSGLGRDIWASDGRHSEYLEDVIQTDAAINLGNSGGPLLNLKGEVIGISTAKEMGADNVGFAIPINQAERIIDSVLETGEIIYPFIGIRYRMVDEYEQTMRGLPVDYGALIIRGGFEEPAVEPGSPASEVDLREGDIITKLEGEKLDSENPLFNAVLDYEPGDSVEIEYIRGEETYTVELELAERALD